VEKRRGEVRRKTGETEIKVALSLDGKGKNRIDTGIGFLDHMLDLFAHHGLFDLKVNVVRGDLDVDTHHTNEDTGICLGLALKKALGSAKGIRRMGSSFVPMDEALARVRVVLDVSGRPALYFRKKRGISSRIKSGGYCLQDAKEFIRAFSINGGLTLHVDVFEGDDVHHTIESIFKALGRSLAEAVRLDKRRRGIPSTKGRLTS
jgi:imidazoleglycerol-phosphate dehydratase